MDYFFVNELVDQLVLGFLPDSKKGVLSKEIQFYISKEYEKLRYTKNILFNNEPIDFYENYIPITLKQNSNEIIVSNPSNFLEKYKKLIVVGAAGSGKTTLLRYLTLKCIESSLMIPVNIELRNFDSTNKFFEDFVAETISKKNSSEVKGLFGKGIFIFILDGFDEIDYKEGQTIITEIENFFSNYSNDKFIVSTRFGTHIENLSHFYVFEINPLNKTEINYFIEKQKLTRSTKNKIASIINSDKSLNKILSVPLFLVLYIHYINNYSDNLIPDKKSVFLRKILDSLFSKHDSVSKLGYVRNRLSKLTKDELENISSVLAFRMFVLSTHQFSKDELYKEYGVIKRNVGVQFDNEQLTYDLTITVNILSENGDYFCFPHILFQEYLTALFISRLERLEKKLFYNGISNNRPIMLSTSLLTLLFELDYRSFTKYFLIPFLEESLKNDNFYLDPKTELYEFVQQNYLKDGNLYSEQLNYHTTKRLIEKLSKKVGSFENNLGELFNP